MIPTLTVSAIPTEGSLADDVWDADVLLALISAERGRDRFGQVFLKDMLAETPSAPAGRRFSSGPESTAGSHPTGSQLFPDEWDLVTDDPADGLTCQHAGELMAGSSDMLSDLVIWARSLSPATQSTA